MTGTSALTGGRFSILPRRHQRRDERGFNSKIPDGYSSTPRRAAVLEFPCAPVLPATSAGGRNRAVAAGRDPFRFRALQGSELSPAHRVSSPSSHRLTRRREPHLLAPCRVQTSTPPRHRLRHRRLSHQPCRMPGPATVFPHTPKLGCRRAGSRRPTCRMV